MDKIHDIVPDLLFTSLDEMFDVWAEGCNTTPDRGQFMRDMSRLFSHLAQAQRKHKAWRGDDKDISLACAVGVIDDEMSEVKIARKEVERASSPEVKACWLRQVNEEVLDVACTCLRFIRGDWK